MHFSNTLIAFFAAFATALPTAEPSDDPKAAYPPPGTVSIKGSYLLCHRDHKLTYMEI